MIIQLNVTFSVGHFSGKFVFSIGIFFHEIQFLTVHFVHAIDLLVCSLHRGHCLHVAIWSVTDAALSNSTCIGNLAQF